MTRVTHLILLLLSLVVILRVGLGDTQFAKDAGVTAEQTGGLGEIPENAVFNPEVSVPLPDLNVGYVFTEDRLLDEDDLAQLNKKDTPVKESVDTVDFDDVTYSGSIIVGDLRRALIAYPAGKSRAQQNPRGGAKKGRVTMKQEQLDQGSEFMGYLVTAVTEDRIVFERNGEKIEKFLYDKDKQRKISENNRPTESVVKKTEERAKGAAPSKPLPPPDLAQRRSQRRLKALSGAAGVMPSIPADKMSPPAADGTLEPLPIDKIFPPAGK